MLTQCIKLMGVLHNHSYIQRSVTDHYHYYINVIIEALPRSLSSLKVYLNSDQKKNICFCIILMNSTLSSLIWRLSEGAINCALIYVGLVHTLYLQDIIFANNIFAINLSWGDFSIKILSIMGLENNKK